MSLQKKYERNLLARIINNKADYYENADIINPDLFHIYADIYQAWQSIIDKQRYPTLTKLVDMLPSHRDDLNDMIRSIDFDTPIIELVGELDESRKNRHIQSALTAAAMQSAADDKVKTLTDAITGLYRTQSSQFTDCYQAAKNALKHISQKSKDAEIPTGFAYLDHLTGGLQRSDLVIIAAETSQGKTSLALSITQNIIGAGKSVAFISLEMTEQQLMIRLIAAKADVSTGDMMDNYEKVQQVASTYASAKLYIADVTNNNMTHILGLIRSACIRYNVDVVFVDYLQLISDKSQKSREQEIGQSARSLKNIAKELNINVVVLSQLSRPAKGYNHYPTLSRLRDSGQVEEAADLVVFIHRPEEYRIDEFEDGTSTHGMAEIIIAKGRNYGTGKFRCQFIRPITKFQDIGNTVGHRHNHAPSAVAQEKEPF